MKYEIIVTIILLAISIFLLPEFGLEEGFIWLSGIIIGIAAIILTVIKVYIFNQKKDNEETLERLTKEFSNSFGKVNSIFYMISSMPEPKLSFAKKFLVQSENQIKKVEEGIILLSESEYFDEIIKETSEIKESESIFAVNSNDERRFFNDPRQKIYFKKNVEAIKDRDVIVKRIFIYDVNQIDFEIGKEKLSAIKMNYDKGIETKIVYKSNLYGRGDLCLDSVIFGSKNPRLYIGFQDKIDETRVSYGELIINEEDIESFRKNFKTLEHMTITESEMIELFDKIK